MISGKCTLVPIGGIRSGNTPTSAARGRELDRAEPALTRQRLISGERAPALLGFVSGPERCYSDLFQRARINYSSISQLNR
jgi:hypothetical protein